MPTDTTTSETETAPAADVVEAVIDAPAADAVVEAPDAESGETALGSAPEADKPDAAVEGAPEKYELSLEGMELDADLVAEAEPLFREANLTQEQAQKFMPLAGKLVEKTADATLQSIIADGAAQRKAWLDDAKAAEDIGGQHWDSALHTAAKGLDALGFTKGSSFRQALEQTGFGNHPDMIRLAKAVGEMVGEDGAFIRPEGGAKAETSIDSRWYGGEKKD